MDANVRELSTDEQTKWAHEQNEQGKTQKELAEILGVNVSTLKSRIATYRKNNGIVSINKNVKTTSSNSRVHVSTSNNSNSPKIESNSAEITQENSAKPTLTENEIKVLKDLVKERQNDIQLFHEYRIYKELSKVPTDEEMIRSAFNISKSTTERLKKYASERRLPLQDIVELALIKLLEEYDVK